MRRSERTLSLLAGAGVATVFAVGAALAGPGPADEPADVVIETATAAALEPVDVAEPAPEPAPEPPVATQLGPKHIAYTPIPNGPKSATVVDDTVNEETEPPAEPPVEPDVASVSKEGGQAEEPAKAEKPKAEKAKADETEKTEKAEKKKDHGSEVKKRDEKSAKKKHGDHHDGHAHGWWPHGHGEVSSCTVDGDQATVDWRAWLYGGEDWTLVDSKGATSQPLGNGKIELSFTGSSGEVHHHDDIVKVKVRAKVTVQHAGGDEKRIPLEAWAKPC